MPRHVLADVLAYVEGERAAAVRRVAAEEKNGALREENSRLREQIAVYAQVIHELRTERSLATTRSEPEVVRELPRD
jgi:hypothetical protein